MPLLLGQNFRSEGFPWRPLRLFLFTFRPPTYLRPQSKVQSKLLADLHCMSAAFLVLTYDCLKLKQKLLSVLDSVRKGYIPFLFGGDCSSLPVVKQQPEVRGNLSRVSEIEDFSYMPVLVELTVQIEGLLHLYSVARAMTPGGFQ